MIWLLLIVLLAVPTQLLAQAATCDDANAVEVHENSSSSPRTISYTTPAGSNQITFMGFGFRNGTQVTVSGVTIGGNAGTIDLTQEWNPVSGGALAYRKNPPSGTNDVVFTLSGGPASNNHFIIWTCSNVDLTAFRSSASANGETGTITITLSDVQSGDVLVDFVATDAVDLAVGADQTVIHDGTAGATSMAGASRQAGSTGGVMSWTITADDWVSMGYALKQATTDDGGQPLWFQ